MTEGTTYVGLDVHVQTIAIAAIDGDGTARDLGTIPNRPEVLAKRLRKLGEPASLVVCYEAGPCGYGIWRQVTAMGMACQVVAPSLIPVRPGDRIKTDRRDAAKLARLLRSGDLVFVAVPTPEQEALRDLSRARETAQHDLHRARQRLLKFFAQQGCAEPTKRTRWTRAWQTWADGIQLVQPSSQLVLEELRAAISTAQARRERLTEALQAAAETGDHAPTVQALRRLHGIGWITAVGIVAEVGDLRRFDHPTQLFAYAGMVPREHSSGGQQHRGGITKTGNKHLRYLLVEAGWHYSRPVPVSVTTASPQTPIDRIVQRARIRLHHRFYQLTGRGKSRNQANVAVARELLGHVWAIGREVHRQTADELRLAA
jgi:transposase